VKIIANNTPVPVSEGGLTKREVFALAAMQAHVANAFIAECYAKTMDEAKQDRMEIDPPEIFHAKWAWRIADAMLKEGTKNA
jgi:hypothetical protein